MAGHSLLLPFETDDPAFALGWEMGRLWEILGRAWEEYVDRGVGLDEPIVMTLHAANAEMILRVAGARGFAARSVDLDDTWIEVTFTEAGA